MTTMSIATTAGLQSRAHRLRMQANSFHPLLAEAYRRRAAELDLRAWLEAVWGSPIDLRHEGAPDEPEPFDASDRRVHSAVA